MAEALALLADVRALVGAAHVLTAPEEMAPHLTDWRQRYRGRALAVVQPSSTAQVAALVALCGRAAVPIVPQGGNTGLVGGATPDASGNALVVSMTRMNRIRALDVVGNTVTAEAGVVLAELQSRCRAAQRLFPLSLASEGSCTLGGNLSTNAGGTAVLRYGTARELCLAIEAVLPSGEVLGAGRGGLHGLRKDNTGYDLRDLLIGAEGTLGIITAAVMKLFPLPRAQVTALAALASPRAALELLARAQERCGSALTAFELVCDLALQLVSKHFAGHRYPFQAPTPYAVLLELSDHDSAQHAAEALESVLREALADGVVSDAVVAQSVAQSRELWALRELISEAQAAEGPNIKHDIALPIARVADFVEATDAALGVAFPGVRIINFGHLGDGNLHYNISPPPHVEASAFLAEQPAVNRLVHDAVDRAGGSISAEHGLGQLKRLENQRYKPATELALMRTIKTALDPANIMNPGKVL